MGRKPEFTDEQVFGWLAHHLTKEPSATVQQVSQGTGVSVGSIYHRYGSMDNLLAEAWLWAVKAYHERSLWIFKRAGQRPAVRAALQVVGMATDEPDKAMILFCIPKRVMVRAGVSDALLGQIETLETEWETAVAEFAERSGFQKDRLRLAVRDVPQAMVCRHFPHEAIPEETGPLVRECAVALLGAVANEHED